MSTIISLIPPNKACTIFTKPDITFPIPWKTPASAGEKLLTAIKKSFHNLIQNALKASQWFHK